MTQKEQKRNSVISAIFNYQNVSNEDAKKHVISYLGDCTNDTRSKKIAATYIVSQESIFRLIYIIYNKFVNKLCDNLQERKPVDEMQFLS